MTSRTSTPAAPGARAARGRLAAHAISSPVSSTNTSSRLAGRRSPSGAAVGRPAAGPRPTCRCGASRARRPAPRPRPRPAGRRAVDLDRLAPGVLARRGRRRPVGDGAAVGHDRHGVGEPLGLLDVVRRHQDRGALAAQPVDQRPQLLADLRVEADGRLVEQDEPRAVHERAARSAAAGACRRRACRRACRGGRSGWRSPARARRRPRRSRAAQPVEVREDDEVLLDRERRCRGCRAAARRRISRARLLGVARQRVAEHLDLALVGDRLRR